MLPLDDIRRRLDAFAPAQLPPPANAREHTAVALVLAGPADRLSLCFIQRATRAGDRWSGQMALPGGRGDPGDRGPRHTAERETHEEVGVDLAGAEPLGALSDIRLRRRGLQVPGILSPFVYYAGNPHPPLQPEPAEVAAAWWYGLDYLWDAANWTEYTWRDPDAHRTFPGIRAGDNVIWGLTYRVLIHLGEALGLPDLPPYE